jgi:hypothetical protein
MKKLSLALAIKEMQIKTTLRFHLTPVKAASIKNTTNNKFKCNKVSVLIILVLVPQPPILEMVSQK